MSGRIAVVDKDNRFVRWEPRRVIHEQRLFHRSIHVLVFDTQGRLVIQRRHADKQTYPRYWDCSISGHVEEEDYPGYPGTFDPDAELEKVYERTASRELKEELGVEAPLSFLGHFPPDPLIRYEHVHLFRATSDGPFVFQKEEIEEIRRVSAKELSAMQEEGEPLTKSLLFFTGWLREKGLWG